MLVSLMLIVFCCNLSLNYFKNNVNKVLQDNHDQKHKVNTMCAPYPDSQYDPCKTSVEFSVCRV